MSWVQQLDLKENPDCENLKNYNWSCLSKYSGEGGYFHLKNRSCKS